MDLIWQYCFGTSHMTFSKFLLWQWLEIWYRSFSLKVYVFLLGVYVIKLSVSNEIICVFNKHHIIFRRYSDHTWNIMCTVGVGLSKHECRTKSPPDRIPPLFFVDEDRIPPSIS